MNTQTLRALLLRRPLLLLSACAASLINKAADVLPEVLIGMAIHIVSHGALPFFGQFGWQTGREQLIALGMLTSVIWGLESVFEYLYLRLWARISNDVQHELRLSAYGRLQKLSMKFFGVNRVGQLTTLLNDDIHHVAYFLEGAERTGINGAIQLVAGTAMIGAIFFYISPQIALVSLVPIPFVVMASLYFRSKIGRAYAAVREKASHIASVMSHNISGIQTIKAFMTGQKEEQRVRQLSTAYCQDSIEASSIAAKFTPSVRIFVLCGFLYTLIKGGLLVLDGQIAVSSYGILIFLTQRMIWPFTSLADIIDSYAKSSAALDRVNRIMDTPVDPVYQGATKHIDGLTIRGAISCQDVVFGYNPEQPILKGFSLTIPARKTIAFVGETGSGKSTFVKLLLRLFAQQDGEIILDGTPINTLPIEQLRSHIGYIGQESFLIPDTLANNIRYGSEKLSSAVIEQAAQDAQIHSFIQNQPQGYDTVIDEHGHQLSGGQRQRLSIARALARDPQVLILDEATSALDNETEAEIAKTLEKLQHSRTIIMIAHRLSTVRHADIIFALANGTVAEQGTHDELVAQNGIYARLWRSQIGE